MQKQAAKAAYIVAEQTAKLQEAARRRALQRRRWDAIHIRTASTRLTEAQDAAFRHFCRKAGCSRYALIGYMIDIWLGFMELEEHREKEAAQNAGRSAGMGNAFSADYQPSTGTFR